MSENNKNLSVLTDEEKFNYLIDILNSFESEGSDDLTKEKIKTLKTGLTFFYQMYKYDEEALEKHRYMHALGVIRSHNNCIKYGSGKSNVDFANEIGMDLKEYNDLIAQAKKEILEYRLKVCREFIKGENYTTINDVAKELDISDMSVINSLIYRVKDEEKNKEE